MTPLPASLQCPHYDQIDLVPCEDGDGMMAYAYDTGDECVISYIHQDTIPLLGERAARELRK